MDQYPSTANPFMWITTVTRTAHVCELGAFFLNII